MPVTNLDPDPGGSTIKEDEGSHAWAYERAKQLNVPGRGSMNKDELYEAIQLAETLPYGRHLDSKEARAEARELKIKGRSRYNSQELAEEVYKRHGWVSEKNVEKQDGLGSQTCSTKAGDEYWPVQYNDGIIGYCLRRQYPAIISAIFMNADQVVPYLMGEKVQLKAWERESYEMSYSSFRKTKPKNSPVRAENDLPR